MYPNRLYVNCGLEGGVQYETSHILLIIFLMLIVELLVDTISFRVELTVHQFPLVTMWKKRKKALLVYMGIIAFGAFNTFLHTFLDTAAMLDCIKADPPLEEVKREHGLIYAATGINLCNVCGPNDINNSSDLYFWCFKLNSTR